METSGETWRAPTESEVSDAFDAVIGTQGGEATPQPAATPAAEEPSRPSGPEAPDVVRDAPAGDTPAPAAAPAAAAPATIEIDGERYSADEVRGWIAELQQRRDQPAEPSEEIRTLTSLVSTLAEQNKALIRQFSKGPKGEEVDEEAEEQPMPPAIAAAIQQNQETIGKIEQYLIEQDAQARQAQQDEFLMSNFDQSLDTLFEEHKVPPAHRELYRNAILFNDPDVTDRLTGRVTKESIARAVRRVFSTYHQAAETQRRQAAHETIQGLRKETKALAPQPAARPPQPAGKPEGKWDTRANIEEFLETLNAVQSQG